MSPWPASMRLGHERVDLGLVAVGDGDARGVGGVRRRASNHDVQGRGGEGEDALALRLHRGERAAALGSRDTCRRTRPRRARLPCVPRRPSAASRASGSPSRSRARKPRFPRDARRGGTRRRGGSPASSCRSHERPSRPPRPRRGGGVVAANLGLARGGVHGGLRADRERRASTTRTLRPRGRTSFERARRLYVRPGRNPDRGGS